MGVCKNKLRGIGVYKNESRDIFVCRSKLGGIGILQKKNQEGSMFVKMN